MRRRSPFLWRCAAESSVPASGPDADSHRNKPSHLAQSMRGLLRQHVAECSSEEISASGGLAEVAPVEDVSPGRCSPLRGELGGEEAVSAERSVNALEPRWRCSVRTVQPSRPVARRAIDLGAAIGAFKRIATHDPRETSSAGTTARESESGRGSRFLGSETADVVGPPAQATFFDLAFEGRLVARSTATVRRCRPHDPTGPR